MPQSLATTDSPSFLWSHSARPAGLQASIRGCVLRATSPEPDELAREVARRLRRDGRLFEVEFDEDGSFFSFPSPDAMSEIADALRAAGHDPDEELIDEAIECASDLDPGWDTDSWDARAGLRVLTAPDHQLEPPGRELCSLHISTPPRRRGHERRAGTNTRVRGSRRSTAARGSPDDDSDPEPQAPQGARRQALSSPALFTGAGR